MELFVNIKRSSLLVKSIYLSVSRFPSLGRFSFDKVCFCNFSPSLSVPARGQLPYVTASCVAPSVHPSGETPVFHQCSDVILHVLSGRRRNVSRAICANTLLCRLLLSIRRCSSSAPTDVDSKRPPSAPSNLQAPKQLIGLDFYGQCRLFCCITSLTLCVFPTKKYDTSYSRRIEKRTYIVTSRTEVTYEFKFWAI